MKSIHILAAVVAFIGLHCSMTVAEEEDLQTEFYLPYSVTEDVDFSLSRPGGYGCFQWSTNVEDVVALEPVFTDYEKMCGNRLEFKILKNNGKENVDFKIIAENVDIASGYDNTDIPTVVEYTIHVRPVAKIEVLGLKTELTAGSEAVPFGVSGYDAEENEFDTLDGLQISWYVGSKREIAIFESFRQVGPIVKVVPVGQGKGAVIAIVSDPNYEKVEPAYMEFSVKANLVIEPDAPYLLEGATAPFKLFEITALKDDEGKPIKRELLTVGESADFTFEVKEPEYVTFDQTSGIATGVKLGETTILVKNSDGEIVKGMPVRVTKASSLTITAEPNPESTQMVKSREYEIKISILNKEGRPIYPSENILCKSTFPRQFELKSVAENGLYAKIVASHLGLGKVKASLRSVLTPDDEELEIVPHVKGSADFEIYDKVEMKPTLTILPWDENTKPVYDLTYKVEGGGQVYAYKVDNEELATVDSEGKVTTTATSSGSFKVKAFMPKSEANFDEAVVHILPPTHLELEAPLVELSTEGIFRGNIRFFTLLPDTDEKVLFTDCSDVPYEIKISDEEAFFVEYQTTRGNAQSPAHCAYFNIKAKKAGATARVSVIYHEPTSGRTLRAHTTVTSYSPLKVLQPTTEHSTFPYKLLLPIGSTGKIVLQGGPRPWASKPSAHYKQMEVADGKIVRSAHFGASNNEDGSYKEDHVYDVTCLKEGNTEVVFRVGNSRTELDEPTATEERVVFVECSMPNKLTFKYQHADGKTPLAHSPKLNRVLANKDQDLHLVYTVKDKKGQTFHNVDSLLIEAKVSDESILSLEADQVTFPQVQVSSSVKVAGKPFHTLKAKGKEGPVDIKVKLAGYNQETLAKAGITDAPALPKVIDDEEDMDYEDEEMFENHGHSLFDEVELHLTTNDEINKYTPK